MANIINLDIQNFRGIKNLLLSFKPNQNLICLIGRGDSGKTTVLDAISLVLSPSWNINFYDTDFYQCNPNVDIEIQATLINFPEKLLSDNKFGLHIRAFNTGTYDIIDDVAIDDIAPPLVPALTIKLVVSDSLEPKWVVANARAQEDISISGKDRALLSCFMISDYVDRHFSWNKGNPLYTLLNSTELENTSDEKNIVIQSLREAKKEIDNHGFNSLDEATNLIKHQALEIGLDISDTTTTLDFKELSIKDGRISLHEGLIPFRQKGKGSKRLASLAIQSVLVRNGGIMLVDEIEQGLEPDRIKQLARHLMEHREGQIFITTHSRDAITELGPDPLLFLLKDKNTDDIEKRFFVLSNEDLKKTVRACPEAFFAKKVIVCEGATEIGICRAMDKWRKQNSIPQMSFKDCAYVDGGGSNIIQRIPEIKRESALMVSAFCDSDCKKINEEKPQWKKDGVTIFDCDDGFCIEKQVFQDLPWSAIKELIDYVIRTHKNGYEEYLKQSIQSKYPPRKNFPDDWKTTDNAEIREALTLASTAKDNRWFKAIHHGEALGNIIFSHFDDIDESSRLKTILTGLSAWINRVGE